VTGRLAVWVTLAALTVACSGAPARGRRVVILGFDGFDFALTRELMAAGRMPNFTRAAATGGFTALATSLPPQSPVAWSTFMTGVDPGAHGIFDFVHRDPATMLPYLSTSRVEDGRYLTLGRWRLPWSAGRVELLRRGQTFWEALEARGVATTIIRMPANFPPSGTATHELSGMGTPDLLGTYGEFSLFTSDERAWTAAPPAGGRVVHVAMTGRTIAAALEGPPQPYLASREPMRLPFTAEVDATGRYARLAIGAEERLLRVGEWSDWVPVALEVKPWQTLRAQCRFYLKAIAPTFELYVSPLNLDPEAPALPISTPRGYAGDLARATGRFYTQGMPEETATLKAGVFTPEEFLEQARSVQAEHRRQFDYVLSRLNAGLLFYYFGNVDQVSHMFWRARDPGHRAYRPGVDSRYAHVVDDLYVEFDGIVGDTLRQLSPDDLLVVMSDHGFTSWSRTFDLNNWLREQGYLVTLQSTRGDEPPRIQFQQTLAYGLGLNGLYLNLRGRETYGTVPEAERRRLLDEISRKLLATIDPATGKPAIARVYLREQIYTSAGHDAAAPDLIIGYAAGTRVSDGSAAGQPSGPTFSDNVGAWSGDHCMDPSAVPGILLTTRPLKLTPAALQDLPRAIVAEFGIQTFPDRR
jgi:predicted AlkP superfamily phosphohydrolase/phosphomutase